MRSPTENGVSESSGVLVREEGRNHAVWFLESKRKEPILSESSAGVSGSQVSGSQVTLGDCRRTASEQFVGRGGDGGRCLG